MLRFTNPTARSENGAPGYKRKQHNNRTQKENGNTRRGIRILGNNVEVHKKHPGATTETKDTL